MMLAVAGSACAGSDSGASSDTDTSPHVGSPRCLEDFVEFFHGELALMSVVEEEVPQALAEYFDVGPLATCVGSSSVTGEQIWTVVPSSGSSMHFTGDQSSGLRPIDTSDVP